MEACRTTGLVSLFLLLFWLLIPGHIHGQQTSEQEKYHIDSTLFVYYQHCKAEIKSPSVMQMLDTLFLMAKEKGDLRMQAVAISSKTDHFYFGPSFEGQEDSLYCIPMPSKTLPGKPINLNIIILPGPTAS